MVAAEFNAELKDDKTLPTSTAAKKPKLQSGITLGFFLEKTILASISLGGWVSRRLSRFHGSAKPKDGQRWKWTEIQQHIQTSRSLMVKIPLKHGFAGWNKCLKISSKNHHLPANYCKPLNKNSIKRDIQSQELFLKI